MAFGKTAIPTLSRSWPSSGGGGTESFSPANNVYILDTNAIIYFLKGDPAAAASLEKILSGKMALYISVITEVELFSFPHLPLAESERIEALLKTLAIIPLDSRLARMAGFIRCSQGLKVPDAIVAATALFTGSTLLTRNVKDFKRVPQLVLIKV